MFESQCIDWYYNFSLGMYMLSKCYTLRQAERVIGARAFEKKMKPKENVKFINSVIRGSARQAWNSDSKHLWKIEKKKWVYNSNEMSRWKSFPFHLQNLVFFVCWSWPCKRKFLLLEETTFSINLGDYQELYIWQRLYEARKDTTVLAKSIQSV